MSVDPDRYQYSIERLDEFYYHSAFNRSNDAPNKMELIKKAMQRLDELWAGNDFHNGDKMRINEVKAVLRLLMQEL